MGAKGPTLHQVAGRAGVSIATVSRVARGLEGVTPETREHVECVILEMGYRANQLGRALARRRHDTLGIVFPGVRGPYYSEVIHGFELEAVAADLSVLILGTEHLPGAVSRTLGIADRTDGMAILGATIPDHDVVRIVRRGVPVVTLARSGIPGIPNLRVDNFSSTVALTTHLIHDHGHRRLVFVGEIADSPDKAQRWAGFVEAHRREGLTPPAEPIHPAWDQASGVEAGWVLLGLPSLPQAVVCGNDEIAMGMLSAFTISGVRVPEDVALTGWDNIPYSEYTTPPLTTVTQPARALGQTTARILLGLIRDRENPPPPETVLSTKPVFRASCGCRMGADLPRAPTTLNSSTEQQIDRR